MNDTTQKRVMTVDRLTLVIESQDRLIKAKDIQIGALVTACSNALSAIKMFPAEILGTGVASDGSYSWPFRDELTTKIENAIREATNG